MALENKMKIDLFFFVLSKKVYEFRVSNSQYKSYQYNHWNSFILQLYLEFKFILNKNIYLYELGYFGWLQHKIDQFKIVLKHVYPLWQKPIYIYILLKKS